MGAYAMSNKAPYRSSGTASGGAASPLREEDLTGQVDGTTTSFTVSRSFDADSIQLYYNGIKQRKTNEYTVTGASTLQTVFTPTATSTLFVAYNPS